MVVAARGGCTASSENFVRHACVKFRRFPLSAFAFVFVGGCCKKKTENVAPFTNCYLASMKKKKQTKTL